MPANPRQCRLNAARFLRLAKRVRKPETRQVFTDMAEMWNRLASVTECDQTLDEPHDALPYPLRLRLGEYT
jgi:hypothetical protein